MKLNVKDYEALENLEDQWDELDERNFDFDKFKLVAKETYHWLEKFFGANSLPLPIVSLLLHVNVFSQGVLMSKEVEAAQIIADTFCDVMNYSGIEGYCYEYRPNGKRTFKVCPDPRKLDQRTNFRGVFLCQSIVMSSKRNW